MIPVKQDLELQGEELLLHQFRDKKNIKAILGSYNNEVEQANKHLFDLINNFTVEKATGIYLEYLGNIVGQKRLGNTDEDYRDLILKKILVNTSDGTPDTLLSILSDLTNTDNVRLWEHFPLSAIYYTDGNNATLSTLQTLKDASPITSELSLIVDTTRQGWVGSEFYEQKVFVVDENGDNVADEFGNQVVALSEGGIIPSKSPRGKSSTFAEILDQSSLIVDESDNNIVDQDSNRLIAFSQEGRAFSDKGVLTELIELGEINGS